MLCAPGDDKQISSHSEMTQALLDGSFTISHVEPGHYYVIGTQPRYVSPLTSIYTSRSERIEASNSSPKKYAINAPKIKNL